MIDITARMVRSRQDCCLVERETKLDALRVTHPGAILHWDFMVPLDISIAELAERRKMPAYPLHYAIPGQPGRPGRTKDGPIRAVRLSAEPVHDPGEGATSTQNGHTDGHN